MNKETKNIKETSEPLSLLDLKNLSEEVRATALTQYGDEISHEGHHILKASVSDSHNHKSSISVIWNCSFGTLGSDRVFEGKIVEFDSNRAVIAVGNLDALGFTLGKTLLKVEILDLEVEAGFLGIAKETKIREEGSKMGLLIVTFSQMDESTKAILWGKLFQLQTLASF